jgi:uncharacterized membrane protein
MAIGVRTAAASARRYDSIWTNRVSSEVWLALALTVLGATLRFATLASQSYWFDEAQAAHEMQLSLTGMLHTLGAQETSPPLYFVIAWLWANVFGTGEAGLRSLSALAGTAAIPIAYLCGRELVSGRAGLVAAAFVAVNPFMIWYSQEAREYMLLGALCGASLWWFARCRRDPSTRNLVGWAVFSALALLTHFFAGFLVAPEALWLLYRIRRRACVAAVAAVAAVEVALVPLAVSDTSHPVGWITAFPLSIRLQQVPVAFGYGSLYQSSWATHGLLGGAIVAVIVAALLIGAGSPAERRGAGVAAALAATVLLAPVAFAVLGHDYFIARALIPAWIPLAVVTAAACTVERARALGAALALALVGSFVYAGVRIAGDWQYQRPDWRGVAALLGPPTGTRAVVADDGALAIDPLTYYLHGVAWAGPGVAPITVSEVDVVGNPFQATASPLPDGARLLGSATVEGYLVDRFAVAPAWHLTPAAIGIRAATLLGPAPPDPVVLIQPGP